MFQFTIQKEVILTPLLALAGAIDRKQPLAVLSNFLLKLDSNILFLTATDLELEISAKVSCDSSLNGGIITVPAKKIIDIIRSLEDGVISTIIVDGGNITIKAARSSFKLATLPADNYPSSTDEPSELELPILRTALLQLLQSTHFTLPQQEVRVYLNGLFFDFQPNKIATIGSDGHRMAICTYDCSNTVNHKLLLPRKAVQEVLRLLQSITDETLLISTGKSHFKLISNQFIFLSKLIEVRFPPYVKAIPRNLDKTLVIDAGVLKKSLMRMIILAHEKSKAVMFQVEDGKATIIANNNEQEEAQETLVAETEGDPISIGFNASYLLDSLNYFGDVKVRLSMLNKDSSILVESLSHNQYQYVLMPMKI